MKNEGQEVTNFDICIGGIFCRPNSSDMSEVDPWETRSSLRNLLKSEKNVERVFELQEKKAEELIKSSGVLLRCIYLGNGEEINTYCWRIPVIFKMDVKKGFSYKDSHGETDILGCPLKAVVLYDGMWFMGAYEPGQCSDTNEAFLFEPRIREILLDMMSRGRKFVTEIVPPCVMHADISFEVNRTKKGGDTKFPRYRSSVKGGKNGSKLVIRYENNRDKVTDDDIAMIMLDIYLNISNKMQSYYLIEALSHWHMKIRGEMVEEYRETCGVVEEYLKTSNWNVVKKIIISNRLGKKVMSLQMKLVDNSLWDNRLMGKSVEIDEYQDEIGIMDHIRGYLKDNINEPYEHSREEYEGFTSTISGIEKMTSQHNFILLGIIVVIGGFIGAIIGSVVG